MAFPSGTAYHADSDADDEYEKSVVASPTRLQSDSDPSSGSTSTEHTPTTYDHQGDDSGLPRTIITEWTPEECAQFVSTLSLPRAYGEAFKEHGIVGEALIALKHDELKEMGIASVGHRLTILKNVYEAKVNQDIPIEADDYVPLSAEKEPQHETATKDDVSRLARSMIKMRDERIAQMEVQLTKMADDYRKLRLELLPVFKMAKERSEPLPYAPYQSATVSPDIYSESITSPPNTAQSVPEKTSLTRSFSKKLGLSSTSKTNSPTHLHSTIHEGRTATDAVNPSAAASAAANQLTAGVSGGGGLSYHSPNTGSIPSPTSPMPYHQPLAPRSYQRDGTTGSRYDGADDNASRNNNSMPSSANDISKPGSGSAKNNHASTLTTTSTASTLVPPREQSASVPPHIGSSIPAGTSNGRVAPSVHGLPQVGNSSTTSTRDGGEDAPSVEIFKSFRVALEDPCHKVLPAALRKYNIQADWRHYALYIVYGDQERCVGLEEKPLALFKDLDREGKKPMFMLRKLANPMDVPLNGIAGTAGIGTVGSGLGGISASPANTSRTLNIGGSAGLGASNGVGGIVGSGGGGGGGGAGLNTSGMSIRTMQSQQQPQSALPGGVL